MTRIATVGRRSALTALALVVLIAPGVVLADANPAPSVSSSAACGPDDRPEPGLQGQLPLAERLNGEAADGYWCNLERIGGYETFTHASFDTFRECAYIPDNISTNVGAGVVVLDVSDPRNPVRTDYLTARAMRSVGESMRVNQARGLLVASYFSWAGTPNPNYSSDGVPEDPDLLRALAVYDVSQDCRHPELLADVIMPNAYGHEGCFQPDGMVYYMSGGSLTPIDLSDPTRPRELRAPLRPSDPMPVLFHGCSISDDGTRGYFSDGQNSQMYIMDTSQVQARIPGAELPILGRFRTPSELQQSMVPVTYDGKPHVVLFTEAKSPSKVCVPGQASYGYTRIVDVSMPESPVEVSKLQTEVMQPENCRHVIGDATIQTRGIDRGDPVVIGVSIVFFGGYDPHFCTPDRLRAPTLLACGQTGSGLRVWDIRDPGTPVEIAYYNTGTNSPTDPTVDWAWARPVIRRDLGQIWWTTINGGFHVARFRPGVWSFEDADPCPDGYDYFAAQYDLSYACT